MLTCASGMAGASSITRSSAVMACSYWRAWSITTAWSKRWRTSACCICRWCSRRDTASGAGVIGAVPASRASATVRKAKKMFLLEFILPPARKLLPAHICTPEAGRIALVDPRERGPSPFASYGLLMWLETHKRHAEESQERDHENHGDHQCSLARADVPRQARMHGRGEREPGDEGPGLQWIPGPEAAPGILGPDG